MIHMVYGDLSQGGGYLTAGAYLGKEDEWMNAIAKWIEALGAAGVKEFHATDFFNARKAFDNDKWRKMDPERGVIPGGPLHEAFAERFTSIPVDSGLIGFAFTIDEEAFTEFMTPVLATVQRKHPDGHPRTRAIMMTLASIGKWLTETNRYFVKGGIQVIFEQEHGAGKFIDFFNECLERNEQFTYSFKSFTTAGKWLPPLQMADLLAHECWRRSKQRRDNPTATIRKSFERMLSDGRISLEYVDREHCIENARRSRDILTRYPDGLIPPEDRRNVP